MKKILEWIKKNIFLCISFGLSLILLVLLRENTLKAVFLEILVWLWYLVGTKTKNFVYSSILLFLVSLPFNISLQIFFKNTDPYVNGIFTNYLVPTLSVIDIFAVLLVISALLERKIKKKDFSLELILLLLWGIFQYILLKEEVSLLGIFRISLYLFCFRIVLENLKIKGDRKILITTYVLVCIEFTIALLQFLKGGSIGLSFLGESVFSSGMKGSSFLDINGNLYIRGYGTFPHPNILAGWFLMSLVILWNEKRKYLFPVIASLGIVLTFSRIGIFLMACFWILNVFEYLKEKGNLRVFSFIGILRGRILNLFNGGDSALEDRINLFKESFRIFKDNWFTGTGYNYFVKEMEDNLPRTANGVLLNQPVHNVFMLSLCELGIPGTILLFISYWKTFLKKKIDIKDLKNIYIFICLICIGMVDHYLFSLPQGLMIGMIMLYFLEDRNGESGIRTHGTR